MKKIIILSILIGFFLCGKCQESPCGFYIETDHEVDEMESLVKSGGFQGVLTIPTVFHIMHLGEAIGEGSNVSDDQIFSALQALNDDFRNTDPQGGVDTEIEFCLASQDPNSNPTDGINRVDATVVDGYAEEGISTSSTSLGGASEVLVKALSIWSRDDYLNIWVVHSIRGTAACVGIQGFAYFPNSSAARDGIVMDDNAFGTVGTVCGNLSDGSILSHEAGHWMYLYHSFQGFCNQDVDNCETQGDKVCDTPPADIVFNCVPTCDGTGNPNLYMSYSNCKTQFSQGQKDRGRDAIANLRTSILTSSGCATPTPCIGDVNGDGTVDITDFIQLNSAYGSTCSDCPEDLNQDGQVSVEDFIVLNSNFGNVCFGGVEIPTNVKGFDVLGRNK